MYKRIISLILCMCLLITACSGKNKPVNEPAVENGETPVESTEDMYELTALKSDDQGIDTESGFQLTSKKDINEKYIKENLNILPEENYKVDKISSTVYNILPLSKLENNKVYQVKISDIGYDYSWAFQTKKKFEIESTLPEDKSTYVPLNSGIELYFSMNNFTDIEDFFEMSPKVEGSFIKNDSSIIFVPEQMEKSTIYTVTVKKGFGLADGSESLGEDYVFSFKTQSDGEPRFCFERPIINIYKDNPKIIDAYVGDEDKEKEFNINIYQYKGADEFAEDVYSFAETGNYPKDKSEKKMSLMQSVKQSPYMVDSVYYYRNAFFELPDDLEKGYYLLEFSSVEADSKQYLFMQINDMLIYNAIFNNQFMVFACDGNSSKEIENANVILNGKSIGMTDEKGVLVFETDATKLKSMKLRVASKGLNDFIYAESLFIGNYYYRSMYNQNKYFMYMDTDRSVYMPDDTVNVWGFAKLRNNKSLNKVKLELVDERTKLVLDTKYVNLTNIGTYEAKFDLNNVTSEYLVIEAYDNNQLISREYISVQKYTKPLYRLKGMVDREYAFSGEKINYKVNAEFFNGPPVPNIELNFNAFRYYGYKTEYEGMEQILKLNENGECSFDVNTDVRSKNWRPATIYLESYNNEAEDSPVYLRDTVEIFPKHEMLEVEQDINDPHSVDILLHKMNIEGYSQDNYDYKSLRGMPLDGSVNVTVTERYYQKVKVGEQYDYINKVNKIEYDYNFVENVVYSDYVDVHSGKANFRIPEFKEDRNYTVTAYYDDVNGGIEEEVYLRSQGYHYYDYYELSGDIGDKFRLNDTANIQLTYGNENVENIEKDNLFAVFMRNGLVDYSVSENTDMKVKFDEDFIPNVYINGIYVKNGYMYPIADYDVLYYDNTERELKLDIKTDKERYEPGEEVTLKINASDEYGRPCRADVNISVVDEAYFAMFPKDVYTLNALYSYSWSDGLIRSYVSNIDLSEEKPQAEKGGGGGEDGIFRDEFEDTNFFKTVTTDSKGNAEVKFKLADNLTSWRITYQGISDKLYAGSGTKNITVSLPFYVDMIMGSEYLLDDKISSAFRVFGTDIKDGDEVEYEITVIDKDTKKETAYAAAGYAGDYTSIELGKLDEGQYDIYAKAKCGGNQDGIREEFSVVDSAVYFNNTNYYRLSDSTVLDNVYSHAVITLFNESTSDFYNSLRDISFSDGNRIDQTVCSMLATEYINRYFDMDLYFDEEKMLNEISKYETESGGIKLFPYSSSDAQLTAKLVHTLNSDYKESKMKLYFNNILKEEEYSSDTAAALWGLSKYKEPVLLAVRSLLESEELGIRDKIYLYLALAELGDNETAKKYYREITLNLEESGDYLYYGNGESDLDNYEITALLAVLGCKVHDYDTSDRLFKYIYNEPSIYTLSNMEQLIYIMDRDIAQLDEVKDLFGEVTVSSNGENKKYKLKLFDRESFAVKKDDIGDVRFSNIRGSIACKVDALGNMDDLEKNKTDDFSISVDYTNAKTYEKQTDFNQSDIVKVTIAPIMSADIERGYYEITYIVPAGFRYMEGYKDSSYGNQNGQKLTFQYYYSKKYHDRDIVFYIQAVQKGKYTVDYAVIKEYLENRLNYIEKSSLAIN
ncbi:MULTISPECIES: Ig-like domain-containing alpha-2-macroglobulin family protein [unclassified Sedimentibacter]|uniref:Ig-like domain-containing alpha-2-macroglobulin family protein n=1 Tax=unclassified Sedimentibacter TaxID=2649220 RepID=UPI0027DEF0E1|nr:Ig-like domain-containing protein [Sedimentibacter sp. MB35-C1]WMJ76047.1 alpha-2-macroglobulin family protein [Sedimentibacter sp. MB35-C1]